MSDRSEPCMVIHSVGANGRRFRPSDWIERISSSVARFGSDRRLRYNELVHPVIIEDEKCLFVSPRLQTQAPKLYQHIMAFAAANSLQVDAHDCRERAA